MYLVGVLAGASGSDVSKNITVDVAGEKIYVNGSLVNDLSSFFEQKGQCDKTVVLMVDRHSKHQKVVSIMDMITKSGCHKIKITPK